jgi:two-component system, cell cycle response regulator
MSLTPTGAGVAQRLAVAARYAGEGRIEDVRAEVEGARRAARGSLDRDDGLLAGTILATVMYNNARYAEALEELAAVRPLLPNANPVRQARFGVIESLVKHSEGDDDGAINGLIGALSGLAEGQLPPTEELALVLGNCSTSLAAVQLFSLAVDAGQAAIDNALALGLSAARFRFQTGYAQLEWAIRGLHVGDVAESHEHFQAAAELLIEALREPAEVGALFVARSYAYLSICQSRLGDPEAARSSVAAARAVRTTWSPEQSWLLAHAEAAALIASGWYAQGARLLAETWADGATRMRTIPLNVDMAYLLGAAAEAGGDLQDALRWYSEVHRRYGQAEYAVANARAEAARLRVAHDGLLLRSKQLEWDARADPLTGVANRRAMDEQLRRRFAEAWPPAEPLSVVVVDVDHFKAINDERGHPVGDQVLRQVARMLRQQVRSGDLCARYGGDEFVLVLTADANAARAVAQKAGSEIARHPWNDVAPGLGVGVTCGVSQRDSQHSPATLFSAADADLLVAKRARGRHTVASA